jgi:plexin A
MSSSSRLVVFLLMLHSVVGFSELDTVFENRLEADNAGTAVVGAAPNPIVSIGFFTEQLNHLAVHRETGELYVGAKNRIYQLSPELEKKSSTITGPKVDSPACTLTECPANVTYDVVDNVNKVLLVHYKAGSLVTCGSVYQGSCTIRSLSNVNTVEQNVREAVAANTAGDSTVSFIGPGSPYPALGSEVMYVATTFTGNSPIRNTVPAVASRSLNPKSMLKVAGLSPRQMSQIFLNAYVRNSYRVQYVFGFSHKGYAYFITTQPLYNSETLSKQFGSKLVRIAQDNIGYESYTELPIECEGHDGVKYNLAQAAYFGRSTHDLLDVVQATIDPNVLYVAFSVGKNKDEVTNHSALCIFPFVTIQRQFLLNTKRCLELKDPRGVNFMTPMAVCEPSKLDESSEDVCGSLASQGLATAPVLTFQTRITAVAVSVGSGFTVAFLGTHLGHLKKVVIESSSSAVRLFFGKSKLNEESFHAKLKNLWHHGSCQN